jgi:hypothetical protein
MMFFSRHELERASLHTYHISIEAQCPPEPGCSRVIRFGISDHACLCCWKDKIAATARLCFQFFLQFFCLQKLASKNFQGPLFSSPNSLSVSCHTASAPNSFIEPGFARRSLTRSWLGYTPEACILIVTSRTSSRIFRLLSSRIFLRYTR